MIVGLTGGIGSGKSYVASLFSDLRVPIYISDIKAKELMYSNDQLKSNIIDLLGSEAYKKGRLNRPWIAQQIFNNKEKLQALNAIVHPAVAQDFAVWYAQQDSHFVIQESAILFASGGDKKCHKVILVTAPQEMRIERVVDRDTTTKEAVMKRIQNQSSDEEKIPKSDFVIQNLDRESTRQQVLKVYETLMKL